MAVSIPDPMSDAETLDLYASGPIPLPGIAPLLMMDTSERRQTAGEGTASTLTTASLSEYETGSAQPLDSILPVSAPLLPAPTITAAADAITLEGALLPVTEGDL